MFEATQPILLRGLGLTLLRYVAVGAFGLLWTITLTRTYTQPEVGLLLVAASFPIFLPPLLDLGLPTAVGYLVASRHYPPDRMLAFVVRSSLLLSVLYLGLVSIGAPLFSLLVNRLNPSLVFGLLAVPFALIVSMAAGYFRGLKEFSRYAQLTAAPVFLLFAISAAAVMVTRPAAAHISVFIIIAYAIPATVVLIYGFRHGSEAGRAEAKTAITYSWPLYVGDAAGALRTRGDTAIIAAILGASAAGLFGTGAVVANQLSVVAQAAFIVVFPFVAARPADDQGSSQVTALASRISFSTTVTISLVLLLLGPFFFELLFGPIYRQSWLVFAAYLPGVIALSVSRVVTSDLVGRARTRLLMKINLVMVVLGTLLLVVFGKMFGPVGGAGAVSATALINTAWRAASLSRITGLPFGSLIGLRRSDISAVLSIPRRKRL